MGDKDKTKAQLVEELNALRARLAELGLTEKDSVEAKDHLSEGGVFERVKHFYESLIEQFPHSLAIYDSRGYFVKGNLAYYELFSAPPTPDYSVFDESNPLNARPGEFIGLIRSGKPARLQEIWHDPHDVNPERPDINLCLDIRSYPLVNPGGEIEFTVLVHQDITERKNAELALKESEIRYRAIVEDQTEFITRYLPGGKITFVNEALCRLTKRSREELIGDSFLNYVPEDDKKIFDEMFRSITAKTPAVTTEHRSILPDGEIRWMQWTNRGIFDDDGNLIEYQAVGRDITELKRASESLSVSEERYRGIVEDQTELICRFDPANCVTFVNSSYCRYFGKKLDELLGKSFMPLIPEDEQARIDEMISTVSAENPISSLTHRVINPKGKTCWLQWTTRGLFDTDGNVVELQAVGRDVTELMQVQQALMESELKYRDLVENVSDIIYSTDEKGYITYISPVIETEYGYDPSKIIGRHFSEFIYEDDIAQSTGNFQSRLEGIKTSSESRVTTSSGEVRWFLISGKPIVVDGETKGIYGIMKDVTARKLAEEEVRAERDRAQKYLDIAEVIMLVLDREGCVSLINRKGCDILGYEEAELIGKDWFDTCLPPSVREEMRTVLHKLLQGDDIHLESHENPILTKSGEERMIAWHNALLFDKDGNFTGMLSSGADITEQKEAEEKLRQASRMEATATLAAGIAHDFNNLMVGVLGNAELLKVELGEQSPAHDRLAGISKAAQQAGDLAQQMLAFARGGKYQPRVVNFNEIIRENLALHESLIPPGIQVVRNLDESLSNIKGDATQLDQVILNLCKNAVESIEGKGTITVTTRDIELDESFLSVHPGLSPGRYVYLSVEDSGSGIEKDVLSNIFEPFYTTKFKGRGLGLAAAYGIIKNHGGVISVYSDPGHGAIFKIYLPSTEADIEKPVKMEDHVPEGNETILIIDDDETVVDVTEGILVRLGYIVLHAYNGMEAVELAKDYTGNIHLALLDMGMPVMDGSEAFPLLRKERPDMKILICSGYELDAASNKLIDAGASGFIQKPFRMKVLAREIREVLDK